MKRNISISGLLLAGLLAIGQTDFGKLKLHLTNNFTDQPITYTTFTLTLNDNVKSTQATDSLGYFLLSDIKKGNYKIEIGCNNFQTLYHTTIISENKTSEVTYKLWPTTFNRIPEKNQKNNRK
jgi:hypothetical protein